MSSQKGNARRSRPQKHQNVFAFKNNLHDTSHRTKAINSLQIANVCERCRKIIEWKVKYKKYKPLKAPAKCNKCEQKTIKHAYHTICGPCARERNVCPKCGNEGELVEPVPSKEEQIKLDAEMQKMLKSLPERKRRTFLRYVNKHTKEKKNKNDQNGDTDENLRENGEEKIDGETTKPSQNIYTTERSFFMAELKRMLDEDSEFDDDSDNDDDNDDDDDDVDDDDDDDDAEDDNDNDKDDNFN